MSEKEKSISEILKNLKKKAVKTVITDIDYQEKKDSNLLGDFFYCRQIKNNPFGKGELKNEKLRQNEVYVFAKKYAFFLSKDFGLVKILNFKNYLKFSYKKFHKDDSEINFDESKLILVKDK